MQFAVPATSSWRGSTTLTRHCGLDALRGLAAILVVLLHAGIPYMTNPLPYLVWPARDAHPSLVVDGLTWCTECFLMPLFFVLAGFFSQGLLISRGRRDFLASRTKRLLSTQLAALVGILPLCLAAWLLGWAGDGLFVPTRFLRGGLRPELRAEVYGVCHLWFLQNLYIYCLALCGASWLMKRIRGQDLSETDPESWRPRFLDQLLASVWKPLVPAIPCAVILYFDTRIVLGFYQTWFPVLTKLAYYAIYFFVGTTFYRHRHILHLHARFGKRYLAIAGLLFMVTLPLIHEHTTLALTGLRLAQLAAQLALFACFATYGLFALFLRTTHGASVAIQYLAGASFWIYLIHLPFVVLAQTAITQLPIPALCKFVLAGTTALALSLMTYQAFVRGTRLGEFLDGCRQFKPRKVSVERTVSDGSVVTLGYAMAVRAIHVASEITLVPSNQQHTKRARIEPTDQSSNSAG